MKDVQAQIIEQSTELAKLSLELASHSTHIQLSAEELKPEEISVHYVRFVATMKKIHTLNVFLNNNIEKAVNV